jgi:hypothetical protein
MHPLKPLKVGESKENNPRTKASLRVLFSQAKFDLYLSVVYILVIIKYPSFSFVQLPRYVFLANYPLIPFSV